MKADIHPDYVETRCAAPAATRSPPARPPRLSRRALQRVPPLLHRQAEAGGHRWPHRPLRAPLRQAQVEVVPSRRHPPARRAPVVVPSSGRWPALVASRVPEGSPLGGRDDLRLPRGPGGHRRRAPGRARRGEAVGLVTARWGLASGAAALGATATLVDAGGRPGTPTGHHGWVLPDGEPRGRSVPPWPGPTAPASPSCTSLAERRAGRRRAGPPGRPLRRPPGVWLVDGTALDAAPRPAPPAAGRRRPRRPSWSPCWSTPGSTSWSSTDGPRRGPRPGGRPGRRRPTTAGEPSTSPPRGRRGPPDREAFAMVHGDLPAAEALARVVAIVRGHRRPGRAAPPAQPARAGALAAGRAVPDPALVGLATCGPPRAPVPAPTWSSATWRSPSARTPTGPRWSSPARSASTSTWCRPPPTPGYSTRARRRCRRHALVPPGCSPCPSATSTPGPGAWPPACAPRRPWRRSPGDWRAAG